jgi:hypothetical protein
MNIDAEIIDITNLDEHPVINLSRGNSKQKSANFGDGIELLMNEKRKNDGGSKNMGGDINLEDLNDLENELNDLSSEIKPMKIKSKSSLFNQALNGGGRDDNIKLNFKNDDDNESVAGSIMSLHDAETLGRATAEKSSFGESKTWDGFGKFNNVPINPDREISDKPRLTPEEMLLEKFKILRKLEEVERKGAKLTKKYSMESSLAEMKGEYELIIAEKERSNSCKFQGRMLMAAITGLEFLNNRFDPFDIKLDGWAEQLNENIGDYDEIFAELHEKYKSKAKMAPELKLLFQLGGSGIMVHMTNTMFKSSMPGMDDIMRQNPELAQQFTQAAVNSMGQQNPGFGGFMSNFMPGNGGGGGAGVNFNSMPSANNMPSANHMRPPQPMPTQQSKSERYAPPSNRPDLSRARDNDGINIQEQFEPVGRQAPERSKAPVRAEMKGPTDIGDLLAGLKTKTINVPTSAPMQTERKQSQINNVMSNRSSSIDAPKTKRKQKSDRNTVSLDI